MNYIAEAFKSLEDVDDSIVVSQPKQDIKESVKKVNNKKSIKESKKSICEDKNSGYYEVEVGVLLTQKDDEYDAYKFDTVYGGKYSFYDEDQYAIDSKDLDKEQKAVTDYVKEGVNGTYGIIKGPYELDDNGSVEDIEDFDYDINSVVFSVCKTQKGKIVTDFLNKDIKESKDDDLFEPDEKYNVYADPKSCIDMIHSIIAYGRDFKDGEDLVQEQEHKHYNYLSKFIDAMGRDKVVELADQQVKRPHRIEKGTYTDSEGLSYNSLIFLDEGCEKKEVKAKKPIKESAEDLQIEYWYDEDSRDMGEGEIYFGSIKSIDDGVNTVKKMIDRDGFASAELLDGKGNVIFGYDGNDSWGSIKESCKPVKEEVSCKFVVVANKNDDRKEFDNKKDAIKYAKEHIADETKVFDCDKKEIWNYQTPEYKNVDEGKKAASKKPIKESRIKFEDLSDNELMDYVVDNFEEITGKPVDVVYNKYDENDNAQPIFDQDGIDATSDKIRDFLSTVAKKSDREIDDLFYKLDDILTDRLYESKKSKKSKKNLKESESINLMDDEDIKKGQEILNSEKKEETEQIVDVDADTIDKLKDSYIGNVILQCPICRTLIYKKPDLLKKDEETGIYNKDEECPHCGSVDGFDLVGQVASLDVEAEDKTIETTGTDVEVKKDIEDIEVEKETAEPEEDKEKEELKDKYDLPDLPDVEGKEEEIKFESLDNRKFDRLVNRYAHNVYENFKGYKSTNGKVDNEKNIIIIEGLISFKDGKNVKTRFVFNKLTESRRGDLVKFRGINESFSKGKNAFTLSAKVENKEIVCESLKYNYKAKLNEEFVLVKGKVDNKSKRK